MSDQVQVAVHRVLVRVHVGRGGAVHARAKTPASVDKQTAFFSMSFSELANENAFWSTFRG
jgi:hypothetical protein